MEKINMDMCGCCNEIWANCNMKHIRLGKHILNLCPECYAEYIKSFNKTQKETIRISYIRKIKRCPDYKGIFFWLNYNKESGNITLFSMQFNYITIIK